MADVTCPKCGKPNPGNLENCQFCQARLQPSDDGFHIQPGESPIRISTAEFEKTQIHPDEEPIRPGQLPTKKNTAELEQVLPSWLRSARGAGDGEQPPASQVAPSPLESSSSETPAESSAEEFPDWLAGLEAESAGDGGDEVPGWLASLGGKVDGETPAATKSPQDHDLFSKTQVSKTREMPAEPETAGSSLPDWLSSLKSEGGGFADTPLEDAETPVEPEPLQQEEAMPDWLAGLKPQGELFTETAATSLEDAEAPLEAATPQFAGEIPDWLAGLKSEEKELTGGKSEIPPGLADVPVEPEPAQPGSEIPDWLTAMKPESEPPLGKTETASGDMPAWLLGIQGDEGALEQEATRGPGTPLQEQTGVPDWLGDVSPGLSKGEAASSLEPPAERPSEPVPEWLTGLQAERKPEGKPAFEYEPVVSPSASEPAEVLPDWLEGVVSGTSSPAGQPALIEGNEQALTAGQPEEDFSMEVPDWLSTLEPEKKAAKSPSAFVQENVPAEALEPGELPSWVQAMRPVESAVADVKPQEAEEQVIESQGPLAGLSGVLPAVPGLGPLRKPPAYSIKLHTNESQQRHAAHLEQMVASESQAGKAGKAAGILSTRLLRWVIAAILLLAVGFPIILGYQSVPAFSGYPSEMGSTINQIDALPTNPPVLIVFDYQPAFVGEMNAAAGPLIDYLLITKGARLALVSTIPTGPALAEWFMQSTQAVHGYQAGQQYINLGYVSGGTAGVINFIQDPVTSTPVLFDQQSAWSLPPLEGVQSLSEFSMLIVLTDSADTGRVWVEQAAQYMDMKPPMVMVVSAQAEPMIRPYFDAGQIQGLVVGLAGGKSLEAITRPGLGRAYWDAFSYGLLVAEILIVVGGIWSMVSGFRSRRISLEEGGA